MDQNQRPESRNVLKLKIDKIYTYKDVYNNKTNSVSINK